MIEGAGRARGRTLVAAGCGSSFSSDRVTSRRRQRRRRGAIEAAEEAGKQLTAVESPLNYAAGLIDAAKLPIPARLSHRRRRGMRLARAGPAHRADQPRRKARDRVVIVSFDGLPITADPSLGIRSLAAPIDAMATDAVAELRRLATAPVACGREILYALC